MGIDYAFLRADQDHDLVSAYDAAPDTGYDPFSALCCDARGLLQMIFIEECFRKLSPHIKSTHIKDTRMHPTRLTTILEECSPGEGALDFGRVLGIIDRYLPADAPVLLEHMTTFEEYAAAYDHLSAAASRAGITL